MHFTPPRGAAALRSLALLTLLAPAAQAQATASTARDQVQTPVPTSNRRAGIEIGAKGVKATVLEVDDGPQGRPAKKLMSAVSNTTVTAGVVPGGEYSADAIRETAAEVGKFADQMRTEFGLKNDQMQVIGSSGLPQAPNRDALVKAVQKSTGLPPMEFITPCREAELIIRGVVPEADRGKSVLIDVGSGNTKGACLGSRGEPICFSVPLGSVTYATKVTKEAADRPFADAAEALRPAALEAPLADQIKRQQELGSRPLVYLSGGAAYALATLLHPEAAVEKKVTLSAKDIADYAAKLRSADTVPDPDLSGITDPKVREAAASEIANVRDNFTRENLLAGAEVLTALSNSFHLDGKTLVFDRDAVMAWVIALTQIIPGEAPTPTPPNPTPAPSIATPAPSALTPEPNSETLPIPPVPGKSLPSGSNG